LTEGDQRTNRVVFTKGKTYVTVKWWSVQLHALFLSTLVGEVQWNMPWIVYVKRFGW
jgi:hypothetical protein